MVDSVPVLWLNEGSILLGPLGLSFLAYSHTELSESPSFATFILPNRSTGSSAYC